jgi:UDP-2,3-diacylglucosamine hydrolase
MSAPLDLVDGRHWDCVDFVSDLHLQASQPAIWQAFLQVLQHTPAQAMFVLGDLFEVWVGDDALDDVAAVFERQCLQALAHHSQHLKLFWLPGNRDFLTGERFASTAHLQTLHDPCTLLLNAETCVLSHGDALCLADTDYMAFRAQVRSPGWQQTFLSQPLSQRLQLAQHMRLQSRQLQQQRGIHADADAQLARDWLQQASATRLIHGHTHRPADHDLGQGLQRIVLSDWSESNGLLRGEVLRWQSDGWQRISAKTP